MELPWNYEEMKNIIIEGIRRQNQECAASNEMGNFWDVFQYMNETGMIYNEADFKIKYIDAITTNILDNRLFSKTTPVLMIRPKKIILQYKKAAKMTDSKAMNERSIRFYLQTSPGFLGKKKGSERFKVIIDGQQQQKFVPGNDGGKRIYMEQFDNPFCFDYELLKNKFELNLETQYTNGFDDDNDKPQMETGDLPFPPPDK